MKPKMSIFCVARLLLSEYIQIFLFAMSRSYVLLDCGDWSGFITTNIFNARSFNFLVFFYGWFLYN